MATKAAKRKGKKTRVGLSVMEEDRIKARLRTTYPSEPWVDATFRRFEDTKGEETIVYRFHDPKAFPPKADHTPMKVCPECGRTVPAISMEGGRCADHQPIKVHRAYGSSPSGNSIQMLQHLHGRIEETRLEPASKRALRNEIRKFKKSLTKNAPSDAHVL